MSTTVADRGATTKSRVDRRLGGELRNSVIRKAAEPKHLPPLRNNDVCLSGFGLTRLENTLRHRVALEQLHVAG